MPHAQIQALRGSEHRFVPVDQGSNLQHRRHFILPALDALDALTVWTTKTSQRISESNDLEEVKEKKLLSFSHPNLRHWIDRCETVCRISSFAYDYS